MRIFIILFSLLMTSCMDTGKVEPLAEPDKTAMPDTSGYVEDGVFVGGPALPGLHFAPSEGSCAAPRQTLQVTACCSNQSCNGHCVYTDSGATACSCYGEVGGCKEGTVCSIREHKCVKAPDARVQ